MRCAYCKTNIEYIPGETVFCPECGAALDKVTAETPEQVTVPVKTEHTPEASAFDFQKIAVEISRKSTRIREEEPAEVPEKSADDADEQSCPYLKVEYDRNFFFLAGAPGVLKLRLTPLRSDLSDILFFVAVMQESGKIRKQLPVHEKLNRGKAFMLPVPHCPENISGMLNFDFRVGCKTSKGTFYYQFSLDFNVFKPVEETTSCIESIVINQNQQIRAGEAGDVSYQEDIGSLLKNAVNPKTPTTYELLTKLLSQVPSFVEVPLSASRWTPEDHLIQGVRYQCDRLLIEWDGKKIYLLNKSKVRLGRVPQKNDIPVRALDRKIPQTEYPNNTVSSIHAEITNSSRGVILTDVSRYGTYVNGSKICQTGIELPGESIVEFGDFDWKIELMQCTGRADHCICQNCTVCQAPSAFLCQAGALNECYLLIWQCFDLGRIDERLAGWVLFSLNGSFLLQTPDEKITAIRPGMNFRHGDQLLHITYFQQK